MRAFPPPRSFLVVLLLASACSCPGPGGGGGGGDGGGGADNAKVESLVLSPDKAFLVVGEKLTLAATAFDELGNQLTDVTVTWTSGSPAVATVTDGEITALTQGFALISAQVGSESAQLAAVVIALPAGTPSTAERLENAREAGLLTEEQVFMYRVFAAFADPRLPIQYKGGPADQSDPFILEELNERFDAFTLPTQTALAPYLLRPADKGSWLNAPLPDTGIDSARPSCRGESSGWTTYNGTASKVDVWYEFAIPGEKAKAEIVSKAIENDIWPKLIDTGLKLQAPIGDSGTCSGRTTKLDVYIVRNMGARGLTVPEGLNNQQAPTYILLSSGLSAADLPGAAAHELLHAIQWSYKTATKQVAYGWLRDATANWAIDYVYGTTQQLEQQYADCFTNLPALPLEDRRTGGCTKPGAAGAARDYGAYLFFQYLAKSGTPETVKKIIEATTTYSTSVEAVDGTISGGFKKHWPLFAKAMWNKPPIDTKPDSFKAWDGLTDGAKSNDLVADLGGQAEATDMLNPEQSNLSNRYYHFTFTDPATRSLLFYNGFLPDKKAGKAIKVLALWNDDAGTWQDEDWSDYEYVGLCRDMKNQRAKDLVIIISNGEFTPSGGGKLTAAKAPYLKRSNMGCFKYEGTVNLLEHHVSWSGVGKTIKSDVSFELNPAFSALNFTHPSFPETLRVGSTLVMTPKGQLTMNISYSTGCTFTGGPYMFPIGMTAGFLQLNPFPELHSPDPAIQSWLSQQKRAYQGAMVDNTIVSVTVTGTGCSSPSQDVTGGLLLTNGAMNGLPVNPPVANAAGELKSNFQSSDAKFDWTLTPKQQP